MLERWQTKNCQRCGIIDYRRRKEVKIITKQWIVQTAKNTRSRYVTKYTFTSGETYPLDNGKTLDAFDAALFYFGCINIGCGFRKRLVSVGEMGTMSVIARQMS